MKDNCAEDWRGQGGGAGSLLSQHPEARLAHHCAQCLAPVRTVTTNKGFQKKAHKEAESYKFKEEKNQSQQSGRKEC